MLTGVKWCKDTYITTPQYSDYVYLADNLREEDKKELLGINKGNNFAELINNAVSFSKEAYTFWDKQRLICIFGVGELEKGVGVPWLLATTTHRDMIRHSRHVIANLRNRYSTLLNGIHKDNKVHIRWLKALGFIIKPRHSDFHLFIWGNDV